MSTSSIVKQFKYILLTYHGDTPRRTGLITINRPAQMNALNDEVMDEIGEVLLHLDRDTSVGCIVITGNEKAFAAGADIGAMATMDFPGVYLDDLITRNWETVLKVRKPVIAAVAGYALGGGCELAMMCDFIIAATSARFGQPEIRIGIIPGGGGTQRLPRAIGKSKTMDMVLTGRMMDAVEAEQSGLVSRVVDPERLLAEALAAAAKICAFGDASVRMAKEAVNRSFESSLAEGLLFERRMLHASFAAPDRNEGMAAFLEKRSAQFHKE